MEFQERSKKGFSKNTKYLKWFFISFLIAVVLYFAYLIGTSIQVSSNAWSEAWDRSVKKYDTDRDRVEDLVADYLKIDKRSIKISPQWVTGWYDVQTSEGVYELQVNDDCSEILKLVKSKPVQEDNYVPIFIPMGK